MPSSLRTHLLNRVPSWEKKIVGNIRIYLKDQLDDSSMNGYYSSSANRIVIRTGCDYTSTFFHEWGHAFDHKVGIHLYNTRISLTDEWVRLSRKHREILNEKGILSQYWSAQLEGEAFAEAYRKLRSGEELPNDIKSFFNYLEHKEILELSEKLRRDFPLSETQRDRKLNEPPRVLSQYSREWVSRDLKEKLDSPNTKSSHISWISDLFGKLIRRRN